MSFNRSLIHRCTIQNFSGSALPTGEIAKTWADRYPGQRCRFVASSERFANEVDGLQVATVYKLFVPGTAVINNRDRITDIVLNATGGTVDAGPYEVLQVLPRNDAGRSAHHIALELEKIN